MPNSPPEPSGPTDTNAGATNAGATSVGGTCPGGGAGPSPPPLRLPVRDKDAHKGSFGRVLLIGGSRGMSGSIALSAQAALRTGSGLVSAAVPDGCLETVAAYHPCVMTVPLAQDRRGRFAFRATHKLAGLVEGVTAVGCGPGMTTGPGSVAIVRDLLRRDDLPRVFDADALNVLAEEGWGDREGPQGRPRRLVLTPHPGELARLAGVGAGDRQRQLAAAERMAFRTGTVIVVKGGPTVAVGPEGRWTNSTGNPGMATAGSGDVLTGVIASLLGQGLNAWDAARLGVWLHGRAGDLAARRWGVVGMVASDLLEAIPEAAREIGGPTKVHPDVP